MSTPPTELSVAELRARLSEVSPLDEQRLRRRLDGTTKISDPAKRRATLAKIDSDLQAAERSLARRRASMPAISYPDELPVSQHKDELLAAIRDHQVVIVAGETGSGKTTQLPKICLELGRGVRGAIGHTQPRRLAARTVAERLAYELGTPVGSAVGWKVRFTDQVGDGTLVKLMTDGILLAEIQSDRQLRAYDTLIIDEAHERSLNIDFILGYVKQLLPRRPDLKVVITSATIDPERFSQHFDDAPIVEVSGRTYPVEVRYRPVIDPDDPDSDPDRDQVQAICDAVGELQAEGPGDILVFLSGEREIRDTADALGKLGLRDTEILPLYARLAAADQHRVFQPHGGRRIVLATNVAETSLTVPGIKYVIDPGTARISRYSHRTKVQRLPIEPISQASANQRKGRCGRTSDGICIRLYTEDGFDARPEFTDPEILRTNLASVILAMAAADLGEMAKFPFIDPPDSRNVTAGTQLLEELGALRSKRKGGSPHLTPIGRQLAQLPVDPRLARMILAAGEFDCVREVAIIAAALSIQDPRERPADQQQAADEKHARFTDKASDFATYLNLWQYLREQQRALSGNQFRKLCRREFLNYLRVREWQDVEAQLRRQAKALGLTIRPAKAELAAGDAVHQALLTGLLSHIGLREGALSRGERTTGDRRGTDRRNADRPNKDSREYLGARGTRFTIFPGSALAKKPPDWVMTAELVETSKLWGRIVARIDPDWVEPLAEHLVKRSYSEPHWSKKQGAVQAYEKVTLYGVPVASRRRVNYGRIDPELARELFIRHALVEGDWETPHEFFHANRKLLEDAEDLEHRVRRRDIVVDDETLFDFYDQRVGAEVVSARHFDSWWKKTKRTQPDLLTFPVSLLVGTAADGVDESDYPDQWEQGDLQLPLSYRFEPGAPDDGVTVDVPLPLLNQLDPDELSWQVPGLREDLVTELIRSLPKALRRNFVPAPEFARAVLNRTKPRGESLLDALERELRHLTGVSIPSDAWDLDKVPAHLLTRFRVLDDAGNVAAEGTDLHALRKQLRPRVAKTLSQAAAGIERSGLRSWTFGTLPSTFEQDAEPHPIKAYPALADDGDSVAIRLFETPERQERAMWAGTRRLLLLTIPSPVKPAVERLSKSAKLALTGGPHGSIGALLDDCLACAADKLMTDHGGPVRDQHAFERLRDHVRADLPDTLYETLLRVEQVVTTALAIERQLAALTSPVVEPSVADIRDQLSRLVYPGFVTDAGWDRLGDLPRYLRAIERRLSKLPENPGRDQLNLERFERIQREYDERLALVRSRPGREPNQQLLDVRWMLEELRVSYFAQELRSAYPVSDKRIRKAMDQATGS